MENQLTSLGKYRVDKVLGEGGMGIVYKGYDPTISRTVALKTIHSYLLEGELGAELRSRFRKEVRAAGRLSHQNIITVYEYQEADDSPYFAMEYVEGKEVSDYLKEGYQFSIEEVIDIGIQVLSALGYAHKSGIVHRDIKPANLMLLNNGIVKVADFGIARIRDVEETQSTQTIEGDLDRTQVGAVLGSPRYMSPEQCLGADIDARSDLYSLALVLYEIVSGQKAFADKTASSISERIKNPTPVAPKTSSKMVLEFFDKILLKALALEPDNRYQTADEFAESLREYKNYRSRKGWLRQHALALAVTSIVIGSAGGYFVWKQFLEPKPYVPALLIQSQAAPVATLDEKQQKRIDRLLKIAKIHVKVGRLVAPMGSNAYFAYELVLKTDPRNKAATDGVLSIAAEIDGQISRLIEKGENEQAKELLSEALKFFPAHKRLQALQAKLDDV